MSYWQEVSTLSRIASRKADQQGRNSIRVTDDAWEADERARKVLEEQLQWERLYEDDELYERLYLVHKDLWYLTYLAQNDITKMPAVRASRFIDSMRTLGRLIEAA